MNFRGGNTTRPRNVGGRLGVPSGLVAHWKLDEVTGTDGANRITNPGFEDYPTSPGLPTSWIRSGAATDDGTNGVTRTKEVTVIRSGSNSFKVAVDWNSAASGLIHGAVFTPTVVAGKSYYYEGYVRIPQVINSGTSISVKVQNTTDAAAVVNPSPSKSTLDVWQKFSGTFQAAAGKSYRVELGLFRGSVPLAAVEEVYFEDFTLDEIQAKDSSGNGNHGTLVGGTNTAGPTIGQDGPKPAFKSFSYDGTDDYIECGVNNLPTGAGQPWSLVVSVFEPTVTSAANRRIVGFGDNTDGRTPQLILLTSGKMVVTTQAVSNDLSDPNAIVANTWTQYAGVCDGTQLRLYRNAELVAGPFTPATANNPIATRCRLGSQLGSSPASFGRGRMSSARIYNRALQPHELKWLLLQQVPR